MNSKLFLFRQEDLHEENRAVHFDDAVSTEAGRQGTVKGLYPPPTHWGGTGGLRIYIYIYHLLHKVMLMYKLLCALFLLNNHSVPLKFLNLFVASFCQCAESARLFRPPANVEPQGIGSPHPL